MSTIPAKQTLATEPTETIEEKFQRLASVWRAETAYVSSSSDLVAHPAFQEIVGMGPAVIPLLLRELEHRTGTGRCGGSRASIRCRRTSGPRARAWRRIEAVEVGQFERAHFAVSPATMQHFAAILHAARCLRKAIA